MFSYNWMKVLREPRSVLVFVYLLRHVNITNYVDMFRLPEIKEIVSYRIFSKYGTGCQNQF